VLFLFLPLFFYKKQTFNNNKKTKNTMENEKLFDDTTFIQKERPTSLSPKEKDDLLITLAKEIIDEGYSKSNIDIIVSDLKELSLSDRGFELANHLSRNCSAEYIFNGSFLDWLENYSWEWKDTLDQKVELWAKVHKPQNKFEYGAKLIINKNLNPDKIKGDIIYVNAVQSHVAKYLVDEDPDRYGGSAFTYEKLESCCEIFEELIYGR